MKRVVEFSMDGITVQLASMTWAQAEKFVEAGQELLKRGEAVPASEWIERTVGTVAIALDVEPSEIKDTYDMPTVNAMFLKVLEISGLRTTTGEAPAVPNSASSAPPSLSVPAGPSTTATSPISVV